MTSRTDHCGMNRCMRTDSTSGLFEAVGDRFAPQPIAAGPWSQQSMAGGPPVALVARVLDRWQNDDRQWQLSRLTGELLRPVPMTPLGVSVEARRLGRRIQVLDAALTDENGTEVFVARGLRVGVVDNGIDVDALGLDVVRSVPDPADCEYWTRETGRSDGESISDAMEVRLVEGRPFDEFGPAHVWLRLLVPLLCGEEIHPLDRAIVCADHANGMSNVVSFKTHLYLNADLTVALHRYPTGEWISLDAITRPSRNGNGTAHGTLSDAEGAFGLTVQSLVIDAR